MKIIQLVYSLSSGGAEKFVVDLANQLAENGNDVTICMLLEEKENRIFNKQFLSSKVNFISLGFDNGFALSKCSRVDNFIRSKKPDIVHCHLNVIPYIFFFGIYGFIKYYAEKLKSLAAQMAVKVLSFASVFFVAFTCFKDLFFGNITLPDVSLWLLAIGGTALFVLYDYIYTLAILIYKKRIKREYVEEIKLSGDENGDEKR